MRLFPAAERGAALRQAAQRFLLLFLIVLVGATERLAEEKKEEKKKEPPSISVVLPLGALRGRTNILHARGLNLTNVTAVLLQDTNIPVRLSILGRKKVEVPKQQEAKRAGDTELELSAEVPASLPLQTISFLVVNADGESAPHSILILNPDRYVEDKEQNGGFAKAQKVEAPTVVGGVIQEPNDVDVFRIEGKAGMALAVEIKASQFGSALDPILSLYDSAGHILLSADDADGSRDAAIKTTLSKEGDYFLSVMDAQDQGSVTHAYYLEIREGSPTNDNLIFKPAASSKLARMRPQIIAPKNAPKPVGPYNHAVRAGDFLFCSGQIPIDPATGDLVKGDIKAETAQVLENIRTILDQEGLSFRDIVKSTVYLLSLNDFAAMNEVYGRYFTADYPARSTVQVSGLPRGAKVEIEVVAHYSTP